MTRVGSAFGVFLVVAAVSAQTPVRDAAAIPAPPTGTGGIAGIVKDHDGNPVRRSSVRVTGDMRLDRSTVTDNEGRFSFAGLPSGRFGVTAVKPGFPRSSYGASRPFRAGSGVFLQEGQQVRDLVLTLGRGAAITGTVYDERGEPMPGVPVMAWEFRTALNGNRTLEFSSGFETVNTDDRGVYRVYGLPPGEYTIGTSWSYHGLPYEVRVLTDAEIRAAFQASMQPGAGQPASTPPSAARYNYSPVFAPGVIDPMTAATFTVAAGEERAGVDLRMQFVPMSRIEGTITSPDGSPYVGTLTIGRRSPVEALNSGSVRPGMTETRFDSGSLSPGTYTVLMEVEKQGDRPALWAQQTVELSPGQPTHVNLALQPALTMAGKILFQGTSLKPPADLSKVLVSLRASGWSASTETSIDPSGAVTINGVIPGEYSMTGSVPGAQPGGAAWRVHSVTIGGRDVTDRRFEVRAGVNDLAVTFSDQMSELTGTITTPAGTPATDYFVIVLPADRAYWIPGSRRITSGRPDRSGQYLIRNLPAGDYRIAVTTDLIPRDLQDASALERLAGQSVPVTLAVGEKKTLDLRTGAGGGEDRRP